MNPILIMQTVLALIELAAKIRESLQQSSEWTPEQEAEYAALKEKAYKSAHWLG